MFHFCMIFLRWKFGRSRKLWDLNSYNFTWTYCILLVYELGTVSNLLNIINCSLKQNFYVFKSHNTFYIFDSTLQNGDVIFLYTFNNSD